VKEHTRVTPKMTIPAPNVLHFRQGRRSISKDAYPDLDAFFADVADAYRRAVRAFYDAGCRYLQLDDTTWSMMCDERELAHSRQRGDEPEKLPAAYARMINRALAGKPADVTVTMHSCRGNFRSTWIAEGGYEPMAERLFNEIEIDGYFLEYDTDRAGGFEPLRFFPKGRKQLVLGLVTSKSGALEKKDEIKRRIRGGDPVRRPRPALSVAAMRLRLHRGRQRPVGGGAMGEATPDRGIGRRDLEMTFAARTRRNACLEQTSAARRTRKQGRTGCNEPRRRSAPIMSAACCARPL
jgi:hypothetical protein